MGSEDISFLFLSFFLSPFAMNVFSSARANGSGYAYDPGFVLLPKNKNDGACI